MDNKQLNSMFNKGEFDHLVRYVNQMTDPCPQSLLLKARVLFIRGQIVPSEIIVDRFLESLDQKIAYEAIIQKSLILTHQGKNDEAYTLMQQSFPKDLIIDDKEIEARSLFCFGTISRKKSQYASSISYYLKSLDIYKEINDKAGAVLVNNYIGMAYSENGDYNQSLVYYKKALEIYHQLKNAHGIAATLDNIGFIYRSLGEIEESLKYFKESLNICQKNDLYQGIVATMCNLGITYRIAGDVQRSLSYLEKSLQIAEEKKFTRHMANILYQIIIMQPTHSIYFEKLQKIATEHMNPIITWQYQLAHIHILKTAQRMKSLVKSQEILDSILQNKKLRFDIMIEAMLCKCELLLVEYSIYEDKVIVNEVLSILEDLYQKAKQQRSYLLSIEILILKSRIEIIQGNFLNADKLLLEAESIAEEKNVSLLKEKIKQEKMKIIENIKFWKNMILQNSSVNEKMEKMELQEYIRKAKEMSVKYK